MQATERAIPSPCAAATSMGPAAPPYRNGDAGVGERPLRAQANDFGRVPVRNEQRRNVLARYPTLEVAIGRRRPAASRRGDMCASGAAAGFHEPTFRLLRRRERDRRMRYPDRRAQSRKDEGIFRAFDRFGVVAENSRHPGDRSDQFRLLLEAGAIDKPDRIIGACQAFDGTGHFAADQASRQSAFKGLIVARLISRVSSSPKTSIARGANPARPADAASARAEFARTMIARR